MKYRLKKGHSNALAIVIEITIKNTLYHTPIEKSPSILEINIKTSAFTKINKITEKYEL